jgi:alkylhydroperoxidase family enzyme
MSRIPYVDPATAPQEVRTILERLPAPLNIFRLMAHAETNFRPLLRLGTVILSEQSLDAKLRELAILRVAALSPARYEWVQHVPIAKMAGATDEQIEALERGDAEADCFDATEKIVLRFTTELVRGARPSEEVFGAINRRFAPREIVELVLAIGYYMTLARLMETADIDLDPPAGTKIVEAAQRAR